MFKSIKKAIASVATLALLAGNATVAMAQTFSDVPTSAWFYDYVEQLVDDGVFSTDKSTFRPNDALNRAELVKIVITAVDGLADYEAPATPTFDDVAKSAWYYDYVEAAVQLGIVSGYTDAAGNLTGMFGPGDTVNRAAATKILVNAFAVPSTLEPGSKFPDVKEGDWFHDFVVTAYNMSILDGYADGRFGPADPVTRAQVAKLTVNAQNPVVRTTTTPGTGTETPPAQGQGDLEVSLNDETPPSSTIPLSATNVEVLAFDLTAAADDVVVTNIVVTRSGVGQTTDWDGLYLYDGAMRLTTSRSISSESNTVTFNPQSLTVKAGTTKTLRVVGDVTATAQASNQHQFFIATAADVTSNAQSVAGDFPVIGNLFTMGSVSVTTVTMSAGSLPAQPVVGASDVEIAAFKLSAGADNDLGIASVALTQNGSLSSANMVNLTLLRGTDVVATAEGFNGDVVTFVLDPVFIIPKGQNKNFYVHTDLTGGRPDTDTVQLYLDEKTDLVAIDQQYGYGAVVTNQYTTTESLAIALKGGTVTFADNGPAATQIAQNSDHVPLLDFSVTADRLITVKDMDLKVYAGIGGNYTDVPAATATTTVAAAGGATAATLTNQTITYTADTAGLAGNNITMNIVVGASDNGGNTATVTVALAGTAITATIDNDTNGGGAETVGQIGLVNCLNSAASGTVAGTGATAGDGNVTCTITNDVTALITAAGGTAATDIAALGVTNLTGGVDGALNLRTGFRLTGNISAAQDIGDVFTVTTPAVGGTTYYCVFTNAQVDATTVLTSDCPNVTLAGGETVTYGLDPYQWIENVRVVDIDTGATLQGPTTRWNATTTKSPTGTPTVNTYYAKTMSEDYDLLAGKTRHLRVEADINRNMPSGLEVKAEVDYTTTEGYLKDVDANKNVSVNDIVGGNLTGRNMTVKQNSLTVAKTSNVISQQYVKGGQALNAFQTALTAGDAGDITIKKMTFRVYGDNDGNFKDGAGTDATGDVEAKTYVSSVSLYDNGTLVAGPVALQLVGATTFSAENGSVYDKALFDNLNIKVPKGQTKNLTVKANLLNNWSTPANVYVAVDMDPSTDVVAEDADANSITANSGNLNRVAGALAMNPYLDIIQSGTLTASSNSGSIASEVLVGGTDEALVATYAFTAQKEAFTVNKLTVINDMTSPRETPADTNVVERVTIAYPNINGTEVTQSGTLTGGSLTFGALGFYVPADKTATLKIYADVKAIASGTFNLSGKSFSLAIKEGTTNTSTTFEAIGVSSSSAKYFDSATDVKNSSNIPAQWVRKAKPVFAKGTQASTAMPTTGGDLYKFTVTANGGDVSFARLVFDVTTSGLSNVGTEDIYDWSFRDSGGSVVGSNIWGVGSDTLTSEVTLAGVAYGAGLADADGAADAGVLNKTYYVIVTFDNEQTVPEGTTQNYTLRASVSGATTDDTLEVSLRKADEAVEVSGIGANFDNDNGNSNTAQVYGGAVAGQGLFDAVAKFANTADNTWVDNRNVIWSDRSGGDVTDGGSAVAFSAVHTYPTVTAGAITADSGTVDWTNGYLLNVDELTGFSFKK